MQGFSGDLNWVHAREGHNGGIYWPGGRSGITLDPGVDVGHADWSVIETAYAEVITPEQMADLFHARGVRGAAARKLLMDIKRRQSPAVNINIAVKDASSLFGIVATPYWEAITRRWPALLDAATPGCVHTAMLSLAFNRGPRNKRLSALGELIALGDWAGIGRAVRNMQQNHKLPGISRRRRMEGELILGEYPA